MQRDEALTLVKQHLKNKNLIKHCLAVEACMRAMAKRLGEDPELWGLAGVLHDLDYEITEKSPDRHTQETIRILGDYDLPQEVLYAIQAHAGMVPCKTPLDWVIFSVDPLTGLIIAATLMHPDRKLQAVDVGFVMRRYKEKSFARGARREDIEQIQNVDMELEPFVGVCLEAMQGIHSELGL